MNSAINLNPTPRPIPTEALSEDLLDQLEAAELSAREELSTVCRDFRQFRMSIPVRDSDSDLVIARAFDGLRKARETIELLQENLEDSIPGWIHDRGMRDMGKIRQERDTYFGLLNHLMATVLTEPQRDQVSRVLQRFTTVH